MRPEQSDIASLSGEQKRSRRSAQVKSDAMKEIEGWAMGGRRAVGACNARSSGRLADNITEERLLQSRIWDLSRERYKVLSQSDYERRSFVDRQLKKSAVFKDLLKDIDLRKKQSPQELEAKQESSFRRRSSTLDRHMVNQAMRDVQSRTDSGLRRPAQTRPRPKTVPANPKDNTGVFNVETTQLTFPSVSPDPGKKSDDEAPSSEQEDRLERLQSTKSAPAMRKVTFAAVGTRRAATQWKRLVSRRQNPGAVEPKPLEDQRYQQLENCLCKTWGDREEPGPHVPLVIQNISSLHVPPRHIRDNKGMARQLKRFMSLPQMSI